MAFNSFPQKLGIPSGTTAQRPANPVIGDTYYDGNLGFLLIWDGTAFIPCSAPAAQPSIVVTDVGTSVAYGTVKGSVAFTEGVSGGKAAGFTAVQSAFSETGTSSPLVVTITGNPGSYSFTGTAYNGFGTSPQALSVSQTLTSVPQAPTIGTATNSGTTSDVVVNWTIGATGGKNLTSQTVTAYNGSTPSATSTVSTSATSATISGLTSGTAYTFKVKSANANGSSLESSASNSITIPIFFSVEMLVVGGGGPGGTYTGGGGGAGGLVYRTENVATGNSTTVTVGGGGPAARFKGTNGGDSVALSYTATGGGAGGGWAASPVRDGNNGGSGGGAGENGGTNLSSPGTSTQNAYSGTGFGNRGGYQTNSADGAGGGGAGAVGSDTAGGSGGNGGNGKQYSINGTATYYAGGGGGEDYNGSNSNGQGGLGGGGSAATGTSTGTAGTANTGGGGGAGGNDSTGSGGNGGSGVVIFAYPDSNPAITTIGGGLTYSVSTSSRSGYRVYTFTAGTGTVTF